MIDNETKKAARKILERRAAVRFAQARTGNSTLPYGGGEEGLMLTILDPLASRAKRRRKQNHRRKMM